MFKKIIILVSLITLSVIVMAEIELMTINDTNFIETVQTRNLRAVKNSESIRVNIVDLEHNFRSYTYYHDDQSIKSFWQENKRGINSINQLTIPLHSGDCKGCHQAYALLRSERQLMNELIRYNSSGTSADSKNSYLRNQFENHVAKTKKAIILINDQEKQELAQAKKEYKNLEDKTDYIRLGKAEKLAAGSTAALGLIKKLELEVRANNFEQAKRLFKEQESVFKLPDSDPPLSNDCYSCHFAISKLHEQAKSVADSAYVVFSTKKGSPQYIQAIEKFDTAIANYRKSTAKITNLSQIVLTKSMNDAKAVRKRFQLVTTMTTTISMFLTLIGAAMIIRWTRKRLSVFSTAIKAITEGDYSHTVHITSNDEFSDLARTFNIMVSKVTQTQASLKSLHLNTVKALIEAIEAKDPYTRGHSENVARYAMLLGHELDLSPEALDRLHAAALLHDIGKIGIREDVLNKPSKLDSAEYEHIKTHPAISAQIVGRIPNLALIASIIKHHHEHFDGKGYVDGLGGEDIPLESRILAIADTFDAMTSDRPYRESCTKQRAFTELRKCSGKQFDPELVERFIHALKGVRISKKQKKQVKEQETKSISA
jgi:HD-GYP domain-containing protein (c-di-GMP phosphodiesterase class II)